MSSVAHKGAKIRFEDINFAQAGSYRWGLTAYSQSKMANVMHAAALARRLDGTGITTYSLHPGKPTSNGSPLGCDEVTSGPMKLVWWLKNCSLGSYRFDDISTVALGQAESCSSREIQCPIKT